VTRTRVVYLSGSINQDALRELCESIIRSLPESYWEKLAQGLGGEQDALTDAPVMEGAIKNDQ